MATIPDPQTVLALLRSIRPKAAPCSPWLRNWWEVTALPLLRDQCLSELRRSDGFPPRIFGFTKQDGSDMGVINVADAMNGDWGSAKSKDITAFIHRIAALVPGCYAAVFVSEVWALHANSEGELDRQRDKYPSLGDHPDRYEAVMLQMLHYEHADNRMMQLSTMIEIEKVLGADRSPAAWQGTKLSDTARTTDPLDTKDGPTMTGRFIFNDTEEDLT